MGTLSSGVSYAMLMRPNKDETAVHSVLNFCFGSDRVNSLYDCHLLCTLCDYNFPFHSAEVFYGLKFFFVIVWTISFQNRFAFKKQETFSMLVCFSINLLSFYNKFCAAIGPCYSYLSQNK